MAFLITTKDEIIEKETYELPFQSTYVHLCFDIRQITKVPLVEGHDVKVFLVDKMGTSFVYIEKELSPEEILYYSGSQSFLGNYQITKKLTQDNLLLLKEWFKDNNMHDNLDVVNHILNLEKKEK